MWELDVAHIHQAANARIKSVICLFAVANVTESFTAVGVFEMRNKNICVKPVAAAEALVHKWKIVLVHYQVSDDYV